MGAHRVCSPTVLGQADIPEVRVGVAWSLVEPPDRRTPGPSSGLRGGAISPPACVRYRGRVDRPAQRIVIIVLALLLVVPLGFMGISGLLSGRQDLPPRPELTKPEPPATMTEQSAAGAEATLEYLLESYTYMMSTGDTSVWAESTDPNCSVCVSFLGNARVLAEQGGYLVDGEFVVESTSFQPAGDADPDGAPVSGTAIVEFQQEASILVEDPESEPIPLEAVTGQIHAQVVWDGQRWLVGDMSYLPDGASPSDGGGMGASDGGGTSEGDLGLGG